LEIAMPSWRAVPNRIGVLLLHAVGRSLDEADRYGTTMNYTLENALDYARKTIPEFDAYIKGKRVLDYGCGPGWQSVAMAVGGAESVHGVDIREVWIQSGLELASRFQLLSRVTFGYDIPGKFDAVLSLGSFEHFDDPALQLVRMADAVRPGGHLLISWAEPWYSAHGSHMSAFFRLPWLNLYVPESVIMEARRRYRNDGAKRYEEVAGGLNRMTVKRYESLVRNCGLEVVEEHLFATKRLPLVTGIPILRELLTSACSCVLRKRA
jgi:SAM-dependent methyltransferase